MLRRILLVCLLLPAGITYGAESTWAFEGALGLAAGYLDYRERDPAGGRLDGESGVMPGVVAAWRARSRPWSATADIRYFAGDLGYDGQTNLGSRVTTRTDERLIDTSARLGYRVHRGGSQGLDLYGGGGLRWWNRDIRSTAQASGVDEIYRWPYLMVGMAWERSVSERVSWSLDLAALHALAPTLDVDFKSAYDSAEVEPDPGLGGRLGVVMRYAMTGGTTLLLAGGYERWDFDASERAPLRQNGVIVGSLFEPESTTDFFSLSVSLELR